MYYIFTVCRRHATIYNMHQCWLRRTTPYGINIRLEWTAIEPISQIPQCVRKYPTIHHFVTEMPQIPKCIRQISHNAPHNVTEILLQSGALWCPGDVFELARGPGVSATAGNDSSTHYLRDAKCFCSDFGVLGFVWSFCTMAFLLSDIHIDR